MTKTARAPRGAQPAATRAASDFLPTETARMLRLWNAGYGLGKLASIFETSAEAVQEVLDAHPDRRGRAAGEAAVYPIAREDLASITSGEAFGPGGPTFARHDAHVAMVMAAGGFGGLTEYREGDRVHLGLPLQYPVYAGVEA